MLKKKKKLKPSGASSVNAKNDDMMMYGNVTTKYGIRYDDEGNVEVDGIDDGRPAAMIQSLPPTVAQRRNNADDELSRYVLHMRFH